MFFLKYACNIDVNHDLIYTKEVDKVYNRMSGFATVHRLIHAASIGASISSGQLPAFLQHQPNEGTKMSLDSNSTSTLSGISPSYKLITDVKSYLP